MNLCSPHRFPSRTPACPTNCCRKGRMLTFKAAGYTLVSCNIASSEVALPSSFLLFVFLYRVPLTKPLVIFRSPRRHRPPLFLFRSNRSSPRPITGSFSSTGATGFLNRTRPRRRCSANSRKCRRRSEASLRRHQPPACLCRTSRRSWSTIANVSVRTRIL